MEVTNPFDFLNFFFWLSILPLIFSVLIFVFFAWLMVRYVRAHEQIANGIDRIEQTLRGKNNTYS